VTQASQSGMEFLIGPTDLASAIPLHVGCAS
jgi:hypothetical protein